MLWKACWHTRSELHIERKRHDQMQTHSVKPVGTLCRFKMVWSCGCVPGHLTDAAIKPRQCAFHLFSHRSLLIQAPPVLRNNMLFFPELLPLHPWRASVFEHLPAFPIWPGAPLHAGCSCAKLKVAHWHLSQSPFGIMLQQLILSAVF